MMFAIALGAFGSLIGSFLNVVIYRVPLGRSVVSPASACGSCGHAIAGYDNIPLVSWLMLRGRCRDCHSWISVRYPLVELATGLFFAGVAIRFAPEIPSAVGGPAAAAAIIALLAFLYLAAVSVALALIDLDVKRLPNAIVLPAYAVGAALLGTASLLTGDGASALTALIGCVGLGVLYLILAVAVPGGMGFGDVKLAGVLGLFLGWLGWPQLVVGAFGAFILGGIFGLVVLAVRRGGRKTSIPFGPWMLAAAWLGIFAGPALANAYLSLFGLV
jgi:leader peptidase (prepilin peptidase)/N-methyltransferase